MPCVPFLLAGGMDGKMLRHFYDAIQAAALAFHGQLNLPVSVGMYNGINAKDPAIVDITQHLVAQYVDFAAVQLAWMLESIYGIYAARAIGHQCAYEKTVFR